MTVRQILLLPLVLIFCAGAYAQEPEEAQKLRRERESKLIEQVLSDAKNLRLPENRAIVVAQAANALWRDDEKRARRLFSDAVADLVAAQTEALGERGSRQFYQTLTSGQSPRLEIIGLIGGRDAGFALELLFRSRTPAIDEAMQNLNGGDNSTLQQYARSEITVEQRLLGLTAEQNPQQAIKRVRESLKKGVSFETAGLLRKIYVKEPEIADRLAAEMAERFLALDYSKQSAEAEIAGSFVAEMGRERGADEKAPKIANELLRRLIVKMTDDWLAAKSPQLYGYWNSQAVVEKSFPERAAQLKKKLDNFNSLYQGGDAEKFNKLMSAEIPPDEMIAQAEKMQGSYRNEIYRRAADKYVTAGNLAQAEKILRTGVIDDNSSYYITQFYLNLANQASSQDRLAEALDFINRVEDENQRINALVGLAGTIYDRKPSENQKPAEDILNQARALLPDAPERQEDINATIALASVYARFAPDESFRLIEALLPTLNELTQANFVMLKFRGYGGVRRDEIQLGGGDLGFNSVLTTLRLLKQHDFERTLDVTGKISRPEIRLRLQIQLLDESGSNTPGFPISCSCSKSCLG